MPWTEKQVHLARAISHGWKPPASSGISMSRSAATKIAAEGTSGHSDSESAEGDRSKGGPAHERSESAATEARERKRLAQRRALSKES